MKGLLLVLWREWDQSGTAKLVEARLRPTPVVRNGNPRPWVESGRGNGGGAGL